MINNSNSNNFGLLGVLLVVLIGLGVGAIVGFLHTKARIASFIVSYAVGCIMTGAAVLIYRGTPIQVKDPLFYRDFAGKTFWYSVHNIDFIRRVYYRRHHHELYGIRTGGFRHR